MTRTHTSYIWKCLYYWINLRQKKCTCFIDKRKQDLLFNIYYLFLEFKVCISNMFPGCNCLRLPQSLHTTLKTLNKWTGTDQLYDVILQFINNILDQILCMWEVLTFELIWFEQHTFKALVCSCLAMKIPCFLPAPQETTARQH